MGKHTIMVIFGTRPEAIKMCPLIIELKKHLELNVIVCVTGQHRELLDQVLDYFGVVPDIDLDIMEKGQSVLEITIKLIEKIANICERIRPELTLVHGDTTTAFTAALCCFYAHFPVAHIEAGLRTYDMDNPFPEEFNRRVITLISSYHFAPTQLAQNNLLEEKVNYNKIFVTGNTVIDSFKWTLNDKCVHEELEWVGENKLIIVTTHRRENQKGALENILSAIRKVVNACYDIKVIFPVHPSPHVREVVYRILGDHERIHLIEPLSVEEMHNFLSRCFLVVTDSGGIQEEVAYLGKPVLVVRKVSEREESIGANMEIVGTEETNIFNACMKLLSDNSEYKRRCVQSFAYGDGKASMRIVDRILEIIEK